MSQKAAVVAGDFREDLQGLRAVAVLLVVFAHARWEVFEGGFVGVDVFFVLSGYLITGILVRELDSTNRIDLVRFYARRFRRLLPALLVVLAGTTVIAMILLSAVEARSQLASAPFASAWLSNIFFAFRAVDYFDELALKDLFLHTWSLGVEEQFYLVWPAFLLIVHAMTGKSCDLARGLIPAFAGIALVSWMLCLYWTVAHADLAFYMMPSRIWQLSLGAITFLLAGKISTGLGRYGLSPALLTVGLGLILGSALWLDNHVAYPGLPALAPTLGTVFVILSGESSIAQRRHVLAQPILTWLGDRSYSIYLWHWPVLTIGFSLGYSDQMLPTLGLVLLAIFLGALSYRIVEYPFWRGRLSKGRPKKVALICVLAISVSVALSYSLLRNMPRGLDVKVGHDGIRTDVPEIYAMGCDDWYRSDTVQPCIFGGAEASRTLVLIGDSIGLQWFSAFPLVFSEPDWRVIVVTKSACPMVDETIFYDRIGQLYEVCDRWRDSVLNGLQGIQPDMVMIGSASTYDFSPDQWAEGSARVFERLSEAADSVLVIPGTPTLGFDGPGCLEREMNEEGWVAEDACRAKGRVERISAVRANLVEAATRFDKVRVLDLTDLVCPDDICRAISPGGVPVYRDGQHLSDSFVRDHSKDIAERVETLFPGIFDVRD